MNQFQTTTQFVTQALIDQDFDNVSLMLDVNLQAGKVISFDLERAIEAGVLAFVDHGNPSAKEKVRRLQARSLQVRWLGTNKCYALVDALDTMVEDYYEGRAQVAQDREIYGEDF